MYTARQLLIWSCRAWPSLIIFVLLCLHLLLIYYFCLNASITNKTIALLLQIVGGLAILYSIDSNMGIIKKKNLLSVFANFLSEFPLLRKTIVIGTVGYSEGASTAKGKGSVGRNPKSIEEKIEYLQEQINWVKRDLEQETKEINEKIDRESSEMKIQIQETKSALQNIGAKMDEISVGSLDVQLFGIFLMIYGAISGYVA